MPQSTHTQPNQLVYLLLTISCGLICSLIWFLICSFFLFWASICYYHLSIGPCPNPHTYAQLTSLCTCSLPYDVALCAHLYNSSYSFFFFFCLYLLLSWTHRCSCPYMLICMIPNMVFFIYLLLPRIHICFCPYMPTDMIPRMVLCPYMLLSWFRIW